jgi:phosphate/phosphite/phosphonate ABC transporter binding protein
MKGALHIGLLGMLLLTGPADAAPAPSRSDDRLASAPLVFIIPPTENVTVMYERFLPVKDHLEKATGRPVVLRVARSHKEAVESIGSAQAHLAYLDPAAYIEARHRAGVVPLAKVAYQGASTLRSVVVTRADAAINKIVEGRGKRLALGSAASSPSSLIPAVMFQEVGIDLSQFAAVDYLEQEDRIALSVLARAHDLGGLSEAVARKYEKDGLKIIKRSEAAPQYVVCACSCLPPSLLKSLRQALLAFPAPSADRPVDAGSGINGFAPAEDRDFDVVRVMIRNLTGKDYLRYDARGVRVAILPLYSAITLYDRFDPLMRYLTKRTGREFKLVIPRDFEHFFAVIERGEADFSYSNPYIYIQLASRDLLTAFATTVLEESGDIFRGIIITHKDSPIQTIVDLKGRSVMVVSFRSAGGFLAQKLFLAENGIDVDRDLKLRVGKRQETVILSVYRKQADAGFVRESALDVLREEIDLGKIRVLAQTPYIPNWPFAATQHVPPDLVRQVLQGLVELDDPATLAAARVKGFIPAGNEAFDDLRRWIGRQTHDAN